MTTYFYCGTFQKDGPGQIGYSSGIVTIPYRIETGEQYEDLRKALAEKAECPLDRFIMTALSLL